MTDFFFSYSQDTEGWPRAFNFPPLVNLTSSWILSGSQGQTLVYGGKCSQDVDHTHPTMSHRISWCLGKRGR